MLRNQVTKPRDSLSACLGLRKITVIFPFGNPKDICMDTCVCVSYLSNILHTTHMNLYIYIYMYMLTHTYIYICLSIHLPTYLAVPPSIYLSIYKYFCIYIYVCVCMSVCLSVCTDFTSLEVTTGDNVPLEATATVNWVIEASPWGGGLNRATGF